MIAANVPTQRPSHARLLIVEASGAIRDRAREDLVDGLEPGDLLVGNDAATLPASLPGIHEASGEAIEIRLAGRSSLNFEDFTQVVAVAFGRGDYRTPTEDRPLPPPFEPGDRLLLGPLRAVVTRRLDHPRLLLLSFEGPPDKIWAGLAYHGRPIQYAHMPQPLELWDVWTRVASRPVAFEPPSAGFILDWRMLRKLQQRGIRFTTLTHAAGISSTGDPELDRRLPFDEAYSLPRATVQTINETRRKGGRIVALGTTVTRALEHAARSGELRSGEGIATQRIGPESRLRIVDAIVSGAHEPTESHYDLLGAFANPMVLQRMSEALDAHHYRTHEFGDWIFLERGTRPQAAAV